jgi:DNA processing protein
MEDEYLAAIAAFPKAKTVFWRRLSGYFPDYKNAWVAPASELKMANIPENTLTDFLDFRSKTEPEAELAKLVKDEVKIITLNNLNYPSNLKEIFNPPFVLFVKGELTEEDSNAIGVVGSRKATDYGKRATSDISRGLAEAGVTIVSGLALGLDTEAHKAAVSGGARTIAVLANGLDAIYPTSNTALAHKILENGAIISEQPIGMPPLKQNFPARNRIISGLSLGLLVTEAGKASGTLHTANFAIEQNRNLYALPGPIYNPLSYGPNSLLKQGAKAVTEAQDILEDFGIEAVKSAPSKPENDDERLIFDILATEPKHIDAITRLSELEGAEISRILSMMEIKGKVKNLGGMVYALK